jgi:hypothetical protein
MWGSVFGGEGVVMGELQERLQQKERGLVAMLWW